MNPKTQFLTGALSASGMPGAAFAGALPQLVNSLSAPKKNIFGNTKPTKNLAPLPMGATAPTPTPSPAKTAFVESVAGSGSQPQYNASSQGGGSPGTFTTPSGAVVSQSGSTIYAPNQNKPSAQDSYRSAFQEYISSLKPSDTENNLAKSLADFDVQSLKDQETALDRGDTMGFATGEAARVNKNNAFQRMGMANSLDAFTRNRTGLSEAAKARVEFEKSLLPKDEGFTLGKDQVRYDAAGNVVARSGSGDSGLGAGYTPGANPTADAWVKLVADGKAKIDNVPDEYRGLVAQGLAAAPSGTDPANKYANSQAKEALTNIDTILGLIDNPDKMQASESPKLRALAGLPIVNRLAAGSSVANLEGALDTVKALVGFDALQKMREASPTGGALGQITERELAFLQSVQGSLNTSQGNEQLKATLGRIKQSFEILNLVSSPDGTVVELDGVPYVKQGDKMIPQTSFNSVGGDTNKASGIIGGYDIRSYATDPNHEKRIATIVGGIPPIASPFQADAYIRKVAPNSPVTGKDVLDAAAATGTPPALILAIMQQDSTFGTKGKAVRTLNPGNVGNTDSGATRTYPTWRDGVFAVAKNLQKRKIS